VLVTAAGVWQAVSRKAAPVEPVATAPAAPSPRTTTPPDQETVFWESVRNSTNRVELEAYLAKYPNGAFAPLARARLATLAAAAPAPDRKPAPEWPRPGARKPGGAGSDSAPIPARPQPDQEALLWASVRNSSDPAELRGYLAQYPDGRFAPLARQRLAALRAAAATPPVAERSAPADERAAAPPKPGPPRAEAVAARPPPNPARFDGSWEAQLACEAFGELPPGGPAFAVEVRTGAAKVNLGTPGKPGHLRLEGKIADDDRLALAGIAISAARSYYGRELAARFDGRFNGRSYDGRGTLGPRKCALTMTRAGS
jgi:hypothetical protein